MPFTCGTCWRKFPAGWQARDQHCAATSHSQPPFECYSCDRFFNTGKAMNQHMDALNHWGTDTGTIYECDDCHDTFSEEGGLREHEVDEHYYCNSCNRYFQSRNGIKMHIRSKIHQSKDMQCPFCKDKYTAATGLMHHLERGNCPNAPLDRASLYEAVRRRDPRGFLAISLNTWQSDVHYEATEMAYNPTKKAYECYFCHRPFRLLSALNQHLSSPTHQRDLYTCPNRLCIKAFSTLAAVVNHLESESCNFMRFDEVQKTAQRIVDPRRMISF